MEADVLEIGRIELQWGNWVGWEALKTDARTGGVKVPDNPGVYEARFIGGDERLTIGKAANLRMRVKQGLVKGKVPHSAGDSIRGYEDTKQVEVRWARTSRPSAAEEELHRRHLDQFGRMPKYVLHT